MTRLARISEAELLGQLLFASLYNNSVRSAEIRPVRLFRVQRSFGPASDCALTSPAAQDISDLTVKLTDGRQLRLHRPILKAWSPIFRAVFNGAPRHPRRGRTHIAAHVVYNCAPPC